MEMLAEQRRYRLLRFLSDSAGYHANEVLLKSVLNDLGIPTSRDRLRTDLNWLEDQGMVELRDVGGMVIAEITPAGADVATGVVTLPGIKRPEPGA